MVPLKWARPQARPLWITDHRPLLKETAPRVSRWRRRRRDQMVAQLIRRRWVKLSATDPLRLPMLLRPSPFRVMQDRPVPPLTRLEKLRRRPLWQLQMIRAHSGTTLRPMARMANRTRPVPRRKRR